MKKSFTWAVFIIGGVVGLASSLGIAELFEVTASDSFCGTACHFMRPMYEAYLGDVHGGANKDGVKAKCVDCHLPHTSVTRYAYQKTYNGVVEGAMTLFSDPAKYDWEANRKNREHFVFDSACLSCHSNLENATMQNHKAFLPHRKYFAKTSNKSCVSCHENVGHKDLGFHLKEYFGDFKNKS